MPLHRGDVTRARDVHDPRSPLFFWALPALVVFGACRQGDDVVATLKGPDTGAPIEDAGQPLPDVSSMDRDAPPPTMDVEVPRPDMTVEDVVIPPPMDSGLPPPMCEANGPTLTIRRVNGEMSEACAGQLAAHTFTHALCTCEDLFIPGVSTLSTDSFDSLSADKTVLSSGAAVGVAGGYPSAPSNIGGSLTVSGTGRLLQLTGNLDVRGDFKLASSARIWSRLSVKRDAWFVAPVGYWALVTIEGNLNLAVPTGSLTGIPDPIIGGSRIPSTFTVDDPCECGDRIDVAETERIGAEQRTDNAMVPIDRTTLTNVVGGMTVTLPCGRFRFDSIGGSGSLQLAITDRAAIFIDKDVTLSVLQLVIGPNPQAEVDVFIRGNLSVGSVKLGDVNRPAATRIYVGGSNDIVLTSGEIGANIYAPNANVNLAVPIGIAGSIYAKNLSLPSAGLVRYDRAILNAGNKCGQPATCDKNRSCNISSVCVNGVCDRCKEDRDCTAPLVCTQGSCQPLLFP